MLSKLAKMNSSLSLNLMYLKYDCNMLSELLKPEDHNAH